MKTSELKLNYKASAFVFANAGTGKTKLLIDRVLLLLLSGTNIQKICCLTFTKKAALEMKDRIYNKLKHWFVAKDIEADLVLLLGRVPTQTEANIAKKIFTQVIDDINAISVNTIHSFCQSILSQFSEGISENLNILEGIEQLDAINKAKKELYKLAEQDAYIGSKIKILANNFNDNTISLILGDLILTQGEKLNYLVSGYGSLDSIVEIVYKLNNVSKKENIKQIEEDFWKDMPNLSQALEILEEHGNNTAKKNALSIKHFSRFHERNGSLKGPGDDTHSFSLAGVDLQYESSDGLQSYINKIALEDYLSIFLKNDFCEEEKDCREEELNWMRKNAWGANIKKQFPEIYSILQKEQERCNVLRNKINSLNIVKLTEAILELSKTIYILYDNQKGGKLDYSDLLIQAKELLNSSDWVLYKISQNIDHILIDECQDTSNLQWEIIDKITENFFTSDAVDLSKKTIFAVGDDKQSIYSFRGANPKTFFEKSSYYREKCFNNNVPFYEISLDTSYRSTKAILNLVDSIFNKHPYKQSVTNLTQAIVHNANRTDSVGKVELAVINSEEEARVKTHLWNKPNIRIKPANIENFLESVNNKIKELLSGNYYIHSQKRNILPKDILILLRDRESKSGLAKKLMYSLRENNIPVADLDRVALNDEILIKDVISVLNFVLLPEDDLNLACLLKSPLIEISEDELMYLALNRGSFSLWHFILEIQKNSISSINIEVIKKIAGLLSDIQSKAKIYSIYELILYIRPFYNKLGTKAEYLINELINIVLKYEENNPISIQNFVNYFTNNKIWVKNENDQDRIKIMTIHASKGLEAPIVFLLDIKPFNKKGGNSADRKFIWLNNDIINIVFFAKNKDSYNKSLYSIVKENKKAEIDEEMRLLYVALTRAKDEIYIFAIGNDNTESSKNENENSWYKIIQEHLSLSEG